jgi:hypothetical protein
LWLQEGHVSRSGPGGRELPSLRLIISIFLLLKATFFLAKLLVLLKATQAPVLVWPPHGSVQKCLSTQQASHNYTHSTRWHNILDPLSLCPLRVKSRRCLKFGCRSRESTQVRCGRSHLPP